MFELDNLKGSDYLRDCGIHGIIIIIIIQVHNLLSETLGARHVSEIVIFRISEW
jgi:hypothetical protein